MHLQLCRFRGRDSQRHIYSEAILKSSILNSVGENIYMINLVNDKHVTCVRWRRMSPTFERSIYQDIQDLLSQVFYYLPSLYISQTEL